MIRKAIILDRDGVIIDNSQHYYIWKKDQLQFIDGIGENIQKLSQKGYLIFVVTNQGGIAKGLYSKEDVFEMHQIIQDYLLPYDVSITDFLFCPHHDTVGKCLCRKPESLMIERIMAKYALGKKNVCFLGDNITDMQAAEKAGIMGIKVDPNKNILPYISSFLK